MILEFNGKPEKYKTYIISDGKLKWVIIDEIGNVINRNPNKYELKDVGKLPEKCGVRRPKYTEEQLLDYLVQFKSKKGKPPSAGDFDNNPEYPSSGVYQRRFGSWSNALKLVGLDVESVIKKGVLVANSQKARFSEMIVIERFEKDFIDLSGENQNSPCDGICPNGKTYDVKSSKLIGYDSFLYWNFGTNNKYKEGIEIYYFLAFRSDWTKLEHVWRVPGEIVEKDYFRVGLNPGYEFTVEDMEEYEITDKFRMYIKKDDII